MKHDFDGDEKIVISIKKARSLLARIERMLEEDRYCIDMMQQNLAVMGLLRSAHQKLMERHLNSCFRSAMESGSEKKKQAMIGEILKVTNLLQK